MKNDDIQYYEWEGFICRTIGDIFTGKAERYIIGMGWRPAHYFDMKEKGTLLLEREARNRMVKIETDRAKARKNEQA